MEDLNILMRICLKEAERAAELDEVPIGALVYHAPSGTVLASAHNRRVLDNDPTAHAEIIALRIAGRRLGSWQLNDCLLVVTLEPCAMCAGAIVNARVPRLLYGASDPKAGAVRTLYNLCEDQRLNHRVEVLEPILADECAAVLKAFFAKQRALGKK